MRLSKSVWILLYILFFSAKTFSQSNETRALWVTRWDYTSPADVQRIVENAAALHFNELLFQVRGNGTVFYDSAIEPWAEEFNGRNPGWDPLKLAIKLAHRKGMQLHAWINVYPAWRGTSPPQDSLQLYFTHPGWFMWDQFGNPQKLNSHYLYLSPTNPDVKKYLLKVSAEIYENYDIDGLHLDYIRFPAVSYSYDPVSVELFKSKYGDTPQNKPLEWSAWRQGSITGFVADLYKSMKIFKPELVLSASVVSEYNRGRRVFLQNSHEWLARGIIDIIYPMIYTDDDTLFENLLLDHRLNDHGRHVYPGIEVKNRNLTRQIKIMRDLGCLGTAIFSYDELFPYHNPENKNVRDLAEIWSQAVPPSPLPWKNVEQDEQGPLITQVHTFPATVKSGNKFKIAAKIIDPSGVYDDKTGSDGQGVYLIYDHKWPPAEGKEVKMSRVKDAQDWFISDGFIPSQKTGLDFRCRIFAWDDYHESAGHPKRNMGFSDIWSLAVLSPNVSYVSTGYFGPELWNPKLLQVDSQGKVWIGMRYNDRIIVLKPDGTKADFSPINSGLSGDYKKIKIDSVNGMAIGTQDVMCVSATRDSSFIFRYDLRTGKSLPGIDTDFEVGEIDCDSHGNIFALEKGSTKWHVFSPTGLEFDGSPFGGGNSGNDIAVLDNAGLVFIGDQSTNQVQCWKGAVEGIHARYWRAKDLPAVDIGWGKVAVDSTDYVYVAHSKRGIITIFNRAGEPIEHLIGGTPPLNAPKDIGVTTSGDTLYVMELVGLGPTKLSTWVRNKSSRTKR